MKIRSPLFIVVPAVIFVILMMVPLLAILSHTTSPARSGAATGEVAPAPAAATPSERVEPAPSAVDLIPTPDVPGKSVVATERATASVAEYISRTFRVPRALALEITELAVAEGEKQNIDPLLILAIIGTESSFNPQARSGVGAEGLMQVMTRVHREKFESFGGVKAAFEPAANIAVGTQILSGLIRRTGSVKRALKWYSGAANHASDYGYSTRVFRELHRLGIAARGNTDEAVKLKVSKATAPTFALHKQPKHMPYERWTMLALNHPGDEAAV